MEGFFIQQTMLSSLSKVDRSEIRKRIFLHLDGWALIPTIHNLNKLDVLQLFLDKQQRTLSAIKGITHTKQG